MMMLDLALVDYKPHSYYSLIHLEPTYSVFVALLNYDVLNLCIPLLMQPNNTMQRLL